jgi:pathogenesis-related protein 1
LIEVGSNLSSGNLFLLPNNSNVAPRPTKQQDKEEERVAQGKNEQLADNIDSSVQQIEISPTREVTLVLIQSKLTDVTVDVLLGEIKADPVIKPVAIVTAGKRYTYSVSACSSITQTPSNIADSPSVQNFLEPDGWSPEAQKILPDFRLASSLQESSNTQSSLPETAKELLEAHNRCRARVGVAPLRWSSKIASFAQDWADSNPTGHRSDKQGYGENMAWGQSIDQMVGMWCSEQARYNANPEQCLSSYEEGETCLHFSQVVWIRTTEIGCGVAPDRNFGKVLVCNYSPPGNYSGQHPY